MAIKLIALDLDGTLLTSDKRVSPAVREALESCIEKGIWIVPATGRSSTGIPPEILTVKGLRYAIATNGASVEDLVENKVLLKHRIEMQYALKILDIVKTYPVMYDAYIEGMGKSEYRFLEALEEYVPNSEIRRLIRQTREGVNSLRDYIEEREVDVDKINVTFKDRAIQKELENILLGLDQIVVTSSVANNLELNAKAATKGNGLAFLTEYLHLKREETMAVGDEGNDQSMIEQAGIGVAMGNGNEQVKSRADYVTATNDEDGVAEAIKKLVFAEGAAEGK